MVFVLVFFVIIDETINKSSSKIMFKATGHPQWIKFFSQDIITDFGHIWSFRFFLHNVVSSWRIETQGKETTYKIMLYSNYTFSLDLSNFG